MGVQFSLGASFFDRSPQAGTLWIASAVAVASAILIVSMVERGCKIPTLILVACAFVFVFDQVVRPIVEKASIALDEAGAR